MERREIIGVTAITEVFPDGQKVIACAVEYDCVIDQSRLTNDAFTVVDRFDTPQYFNDAMGIGGGIVDAPRTVTRVYANTEPETAREGKDGRFVIIEMSPKDRSAATVYLVGFEWASLAHMKHICLRVTQNRPIAAADGGVCPAPEWPVVNNRIRNRVVDEFRQLEFEGLKYNLFVPQHYDSRKQYPLVQFIVDSWGLGKEHEITLSQGIGGVIWARPEEQAARECFVVAPQFEGPRLCDDDWATSPDVEKDKRLLDYLLETYSIDRDRVYTTGQSMGYLAGCELNIRYPGFFAGSLMVSGFWNPETMTALKGQNMWFFVSEGDTRAYKNTKAAMENLEALGEKVGCYHWDGKAGKDVLNAAIREAMKDGCNLRFTFFKKDSTVPDAVQVKNEATNHRGTWELVYDLEAAREWLFSNQGRNPGQGG